MAREPARQGEKGDASGGSVGFSPRHRRNRRPCPADLICKMAYRDPEKRREWTRANYAANAATLRKKKRDRYAANPTPHRERSRKWVLANRPRVNELQRLRRSADPAKDNERKKTWRAANLEKARALQREASRRWYAANRQTHYARQRITVSRNPTKYRQKEREALQRRRLANPEKHRDEEQRRRAALLSVPSTVTSEQLRFLRAKSKKCHWCGKAFTRNQPATHDHVIPLSKGGPNTLENSCFAHGSCNSKKGARSYNPATGQGILL